MEVQVNERDVRLPGVESIVRRCRFTFTLQMDEYGYFTDRAYYVGNEDSILRLISPCEFTLQIKVNFEVHPRLLSLRMAVRDSNNRTFWASAIEDVPNEYRDYGEIVGNFRTLYGIFADIEDRKIIVELEMDMLLGMRNFPPQNIAPGG